MSEVLDLPAIDPALIEPPATPRTHVAVAAAAALDLTKVDLTDVALAQFGPWRTAVADVTKNIATLALDLSNQARIDEAKTLRYRLIGQPRADIRKVSKELKSKLAKVSKAIGAEEDAAVLAYDEAEKPLTEQIDAAQKKIDDEKEAKRLAEQQRLQGLRDEVDGLMAPWIDRCSADGITSERIGAGIEKLRAVAMPSVLADVALYWDATKLTTINAMGKLQAAAEAREEAARIEAQRLENERVAAELAAQRAELERQQQEIEAARQRADAPAAPVATAAATEGKADNPEPGKLEAAPINGDDGQATRACVDEQSKGHGCYPAVAAPGGNQSVSSLPDTTSEAAPQQASDPVNPEADAAPGGTEGHGSDLLPDGWDGLLRTDAPPPAPASAAGHAADIAGRDWTNVAFTPETGHSEHAPIGRVFMIEPGHGIDADDLHSLSLAFVRLVLAARAGRFPSHPKPEQSWWAEVYAAGDALLPRLAKVCGEAA